MENVDNIILEHLRAIRADIGAMKDDSREIKQRLANLESAIGGIKRDLGDVYTEGATQHTRNDRIIERIEKIERRLEIQ